MHIHDLQHPKSVVQACREPAFTFSIKFLWRVTNNNIVIPVCFQLYVLTVKFIGVQNQGDISLFPYKKNTEKEIYKIWGYQLLHRHTSTCKNMKGRASEHLPKLCRNFNI